MSTASSCHIAVLMALVSAVVALPPAGRVLLQTSPSTCNIQIPSCKAGKCMSKDAGGGVFVKVCLSCKTGYQPSKELQHCVCPPGTYEQCDASNNCTCADCGAGFYCPGGNRGAVNNATAADRGQRLSCAGGQVNASDTTASVQALGLTTLRNRSMWHTECLPMPGFRLDVATRNGQTAVRCTGATYSPGYKRIRTCLKCQSGLIADPALTDTSIRADRMAVCKIPAGSYLSQNLVRPCPQGRYRAGIAGVEDPIGRLCLECTAGYSTAGPGANTSSACSIGLAGFELGMSAGTSTGTNSSAPSQCMYGTYYAGGAVTPNQSTCVACPGGSTTKTRGATDVGECMVPPGYYIKGDTMVKCPTNITTNNVAQGYYRSLWVSYSDPTVKELSTGDGSSACTPCGAGILSELTDIDENNGGTNTPPEDGSNITSSRVAGSQQSCYILPGQGMTLNPATSQFKAEDCPVATYGAPGNRTAGDRIYGPVAVPCKPCPRYMTSPALSTAYSDCVNAPGYGLVAEGSTVSAVPCAEGFYTVPFAPCKQCPYGRTTKTGSANLQGSINDCYVKAGYGLFFSNTSSWTVPEGVSIPTDKIPDDASIQVLPCPAGYYGPGGIALNITNSLCTACSAGSSSAPGSTQDSDCNAACQAGYGLNSNGSCAICAAGDYSDGTTNTCMMCRSALFVYKTSSGLAESITSKGTTLRAGAQASEECVSPRNQLFSDAGTSFALDNLGSWTAIGSGKTMSQCLDECDPTTCCFAQLQYSGSATGACSMLELAPAPTAATTGYQIYYKLVPSDAISAYTVGNDTAKAKMVSSTNYKACTTANWEALLSVSSNIVGNAVEGHESIQTSVTPEQCQSDCDNTAACYGFLYTPTNGGKCLLRTGQAVTDTRSFFTIPSTTVSCGAGKYRNMAANGVCTACPAGSSGDGKRTTCTCNAGYQSNGQLGAALVCTPMTCAAMNCPTSVEACRVGGGCANAVCLPIQNATDGSPCSTGQYVGSCQDGTCIQEVACRAWGAEPVPASATLQHGECPSGQYVVATQIGTGWVWDWTQIWCNSNLSAGIVGSTVNFTVGGGGGSAKPIVETTVGFTKALVTTTSPPGFGPSMLGLNWFEGPPVNAYKGYQSGIKNTLNSTVLQCPVGQVVTGACMYADDYMRQFGIICGPVI